MRNDLPRTHVDASIPDDVPETIRPAARRGVTPLLRCALIAAGIGALLGGGTAALLATGRAPDAARGGARERTALRLAAIDANALAGSASGRHDGSAEGLHEWKPGDSQLVWGRWPDPNVQPAAPCARRTAAPVGRPADDDDQM
jgi:hypothetical protein